MFCVAHIAHIAFIVSGIADQLFAGQLSFATRSLVNDVVASMVTHLFPLPRLDECAKAARAESGPAIELAQFNAR
jgi:hypothetical protein